MSFLEYAFVGCMLLVCLVAAMLWLNEWATKDLHNPLQAPAPLPEIDPKRLSACGNGVMCNKSTNCLDINCPGRQ